MSSKTTTSTSDHRKDAFPEEEAILARFLTRVGEGARKTVDVLSHGSFLLL
jgi:hypothetical protein